MRTSVTAALIGAALLFVGIHSIAQCEVLSDKKNREFVTKDSVWNPDRQVVQVARQKCSDFGGRQLEECFADAMESLGASSDAAAFTRTFGGGAFVRKFRESGRRDVAYVMFPFRANELNGILLVNGEPPIIDVDDVILLPKEAMEQDKAFAAIRRVFPKATLWPGDRSPKFPTIEPLPDGGQSFVVPYNLRNFCHACEVLATVYFSFDFDRDGRLTGERFMRVEPTPKKVTMKTDSRKDTEQIRFIVMTEEGKEFTVRLGSNRTTGFQWRPAEPIDERIVKLVRSEYAPFDKGSAVGVGGEEVWTFLGVAKGDTEITMEYVRPWEKNQAVLRTATIKVTVKPASQKQ
jgi:predicted secreted protein